jgi:response regulator RpfG family c-di-GMP phosphodiesterase
VPEREWPHIERGALLHDIGKIGISDTVLLKNGPLSEDEWKIVRLHPLFGYQMVHGIPFLERASQIILHHHERWDGRGYPFGLRTDAIPLPARIFAVADAMDAITSGRPYKEKQDWDEVSKALVSNSGNQFDPQVVQAYLHIPLPRWQRIQEEIERESRALAPPTLAEIESRFAPAGRPAAAPPPPRSGAISASVIPRRVIDRMASDIEPAGGRARKAERVLLVDDEATVGPFLSKLLEQAGYEVDAAPDAEEALKRLKSSAYDLAIIDYLLPGQDGQALYRRLIDLDPELARRVLVISGAPLESGLLQFLTRNRVPFLRKPFRPDELISAVRGIEAR